MARRRLNVVISSTVRDLPEHRQHAMDACLRADVFPTMMEHLPALDAEAIAASLKLVDDADIYVGVFAFRYGHVPAGHAISITQMEYERAVARGIPRLIFLMGDQHPVKPADVEKGEGGAKLDALRAKLQIERVASFFDSPERFRGDLIQALEHAKKQLEGEPIPGASLHYVADIPPAPESYVAHPYTLLQTRGLIGRRAELEQLTDWIVHPERSGHATILCIVGLGGMGKSALTWHWYSEVVAQEMKPLAGRMWWSFYESDAHFENFVIRALAYVSGRDRGEVAKKPAADREQDLLAILDKKPFVLVLDGFERELVAYSGMRAAYVQDQDLEDEAAGRVVGAVGLPQSAAQTFVGRHPQRKTTDPRVGSFLVKLAKVRASRVLVSTRLYPAELQTATGEPRPGCAALFVEGLSPGDALELWRAHGARGSREVMLPLFDRFDRHPLLIQVLAGEVARFREAPGDLDVWHRANPQFDPFGLPLVQVRSHVLSIALRGLAPKDLRTLHVIAGFRMPTSLDTLKALLIRTGEQGDAAASETPFASLGELDAALGSLEDSGLLGWDRRSNRYDLHPIVRGVTWSGLGEGGRADIYAALQVHFEAMPAVEWTEVESLEDLTPGIELFHSLVGLGRYDDASDIFFDRLWEAMNVRLSAGRTMAEMLERLFPDGVAAPPRLETARTRSRALNSLALAYDYAGRSGFAVPIFLRSIEIDEAEGDDRNRGIALSNLSAGLRITGDLLGAFAAARGALLIARQASDRNQEAEDLSSASLTLAVRGDVAKSEIGLRRCLRICVAESRLEDEGLLNSELARNALWIRKPAIARKRADRAWDLASIRRFEVDLIIAANLQGRAALALDDFEAARERLHDALARARACHRVLHELRSLTALAELACRRGQPDLSRELLDDVWELAECGPYPLLHADARNVLAQLERDAGNRDASIEAARRAFELAWCNGPPWAYHFGLENARQHLAELGAPEPELPPFDPSKYDPMPEVELDPDDEFHAGRKPESSGPIDVQE